MKAATCTSILLVLLVFATARAADPQPASPSKEHQWLEQLAGEWETEAEAMFGPDMTFKCKGVEKARMVGGFWLVGEIDSKMMDKEMKGILTVGYDAQKKKYVGTWTDSMTPHLWKYEGSLDDSGKVLTLEADGPNPLDPGKTAKFRDVIEVKSKDHKIMTSSMLGEDGKWLQFMTMHFRRRP